MQRATTAAKAEFAYLMAIHSAASLSQIQRLMRYGSSYGRFQEMACNDQLTEQQMGKEQRLERAIDLLCKEFGATPKFSGDPRGNTVKIQVPDGYTNDWGKEGICVPTS